MFALYCLPANIAGFQGAEPFAERAMEELVLSGGEKCAIFKQGDYLGFIHFLFLCYPALIGCDG